AEIIQDFDHLREQTENRGLFQAQPLFFCLHLGHILVLEAIAWLMVSYWGTSWTMTLLCSVLLATAQVFRKSLVCMGDSNEPLANGDRSREAPRLADHAGCHATTTSWWPHRSASCVRNTGFLMRQKLCGEEWLTCSGNNRIPAFLARLHRVTVMV
ncbi:hypothetical protein GOODEAATRI_013756, partial [Goodea atripinnis]